MKILFHQIRNTALPCSWGHGALLDSTTGIHSWSRTKKSGISSQNYELRYMIRLHSGIPSYFWTTSADRHRDRWDSRPPEIFVTRYINRTCRGSNVRWHIMPPMSVWCKSTLRVSIRPGEKIYLAWMREHFATAANTFVTPEGHSEACGPAFKGWKTPHTGVGKTGRPILSM